MILNFAYPSSSDRTGGVIVLYELANACARRGHEVHFVHGPLTPYRVGSLDELPPFRFEDRVEHHLVDALDDPQLPAGDVVFVGTAPRRLGLPVEIVQGFRMLREDVERDLFRSAVPKACVASWLVDVGLGYGSPARAAVVRAPGDRPPPVHGADAAGPSAATTSPCCPTRTERRGSAWAWRRWRS